MGITSNSNSDNWGMGFLLVFFTSEQKTLPITSATSSSPFTHTVTPLSRNTANHIINKTKSAISICAILFFLSLLLLTLEPNPTNHLTPRRLLLSSPTKFTNKPFFALQKMGVLHRRGTKGMHDLIVGHVTESLTPQDLKFFLRLYHFSNFSSKSDLVLIFPTDSIVFENVISEEIESFSKLNSTHFVKLGSKEEEPLWGKKSRTGNFTENESTQYGETESTRPSYGSVVSFVVDELDPENSLSGFLDHVAMSMRRWASYPMLLGRVRRNFKHVILVDVKEVLLLGDPLGQVRARPSESVQFTANAILAKKRHSAELVTQKRGVNSALVLGGTRGVRMLANAMLNEIVRSATVAQHKRKNLVAESVIFNQLAGNVHVLKSVNVNAFTESVPDVSSLGRIMGFGKFTAVRRGNSNVDVNSVIRKHICSSLRVNSSVYSDC